MRKPSKSFIRLAAMLVLCVAAPLALVARYQPKPPWNLFSRQQDVDIGKQAAADTNKKIPLLKESDPITRYVERLGADLAAHAPGPAYPYTFRVVNQKEINAFALPGGPIYVNLGTIQAADNEAQLAGVMGHEIGHVVMRHATAGASKQMLAQAPLAILGGMVGSGLGAQLAQMGISFGVGSYFLKNSRSAEAQADLVGTDIMYDTGFDPHALPEFFLKLEKGAGSAARGPQFMSDHPNPGNRAEAVGREVSTLPGKSYRSDSTDFKDVKRLATGMKALTAKEIAEQQKHGSETIQDAPVGQVMASENFKTLNHSAFRVGYPENWEVFGDESSAVTIAPRSGVAESAVAYGVIISGYQPERGSGASLDDATHQLISTLRQANSEMRIVGHDEDIRVGGARGKSVDLIGTSPIRDSGGKALRERDWLVTVQRDDGSLLYMIFIAPDRDFAQMRPAFEKMEQSFRLR